MKTPPPSRPKAFISAPSLNSPTTRGCNWWRVSQASNCGRTEELPPGTSIGAPFRQAGKGAVSVCFSPGEA